MLKLKCHIQCSGPQPARPQLEVFVLAVKGVPSFSSSSLFCFYLLLVGWTNERDFRKEPKPFDFTAARNFPESCYFSHLFCSTGFLEPLLCQRGTPWRFLIFLKCFTVRDVFLGYQVGTEELSCWSIRILLKAYYM